MTFHCTLFEEDPVIPVAFLLHERKHKSEFFDVCCKLIPALKKTHKPIVTDEEQAYVNMISKFMLAAPHLRCWNHVVQAAERWLHRHGTTCDNMVVYCSDLNELVHLPPKKIMQSNSAKCLKMECPIFELLQ